ncbi:hypothetical protein STAN_3875 [Streptomyces sp. CBMAI 2042]|nr:hypothetical protein STAN_3875 [Streptomyces sp. CBMAI 2042]
MVAKSNLRYVTPHVVLKNKRENLGWQDP